MPTCCGCGIDYKLQKSSRGLYCSNQCQQIYKQLLHYRRWLAGEIVSHKTGTLGNLLRRFEGNKCALCGIQEWLGSPLKMQCDHIDGNPENNRYENIRLVCYNCDAQSPTFKGRNLGNGRHARRQRYAQGKSY